MGKYTDPFSGTKQVDSNHRYKKPYSGTDSGEALAMLAGTVQSLQAAITELKTQPHTPQDGNDWEWDEI